MFLLPLRDDVCEDGVLVVLADELEGGGTATDIVGLQQVTWCERLHINTLPIAQMLGGTWFQLQQAQAGARLGAALTAMGGGITAIIAIFIAYTYSHQGHYSRLHKQQMNVNNNVNHQKISVSDNCEKQMSPTIFLIRKS